jgi:septum formation protein
MRDNNRKWQLILASSSPRRRELLGHTKVPFRIETIPTDEVSEASDPRTYALEIARQKGAVLCGTLQAQSVVVVSADTVVALNGKIYGKPRDTSEARQFLTELADHTHQVHTAVCLHFGWQGQWKRIDHVETTEVGFMSLSPRLLEDYLATGDSLDKAGAYGIQGQALTFIRDVRGCYANVVGFPLARFCSMMEQDFLQQIGEQGPWQNLFL